MLLVCGEASWHIWMLATGQWIIQIMLPLWLCSLAIWLSPLMLIQRRQFFYEFLYFMGILGGTMALLTPDLGIYGFPHYRFIEFLLVHGALVAAPIYMTIVEGFRPTWGSLGRVALVMLPYLAFVTWVNFRIGSNYLYTAGKLPTPSLLDLLSPWPYYIPEMIALAAAVLRAAVPALCHRGCPACTPPLILPAYPEDIGRHIQGVKIYARGHIQACW